METVTLDGKHFVIPWSADIRIDEIQPARLPLVVALIVGMVLGAALMYVGLDHE